MRNFIGIPVLAALALIADFAPGASAAPEPDLQFEIKYIAFQKCYEIVSRHRIAQLKGIPKTEVLDIEVDSFVNLLLTDEIPESDIDAVAYIADALFRDNDKDRMAFFDMIAYSCAGKMLDQIYGG